MGKLIKAELACGITAPLVGYAFIAAALIKAPWFDWSRNALSDLGIAPGSAPFFNLGLILAGLLVVAYGHGLAQTLSRRLGKAAGLWLSIAGLALALIGVFPEDCGDIHYYVSVAFFVNIPLALIALGASLATQRQRRLGFIVAALALASVAPWLKPWDGVAIPELASSLLASAAVVTTSATKLRSNPHSVANPSSTNAVFKAVGKALTRGASHE